MTSTFHCPVCGLTRHNRPATYRHRCPGPKSAEYSKHRAKADPPPSPLKQKKAKPVSLLPVISPTVAEKPKRRPRKPKPGRELEALIPKFFATGGCGCQSYARQMDRWGVEGCEERFDEIVDHLCEQAKSQRVIGMFGVINRMVAKRWVRQAIDTALVSLD